MSNLKENLERINSVALMEQITKTMKLVSVSKLMKLQSTLNNSRSFLDAITTIQKRTDKLESISITDKIKVTDQTLIILIGTNKGFCGSFNNNIVKKIHEYIKPNTNVMPIGEKINTQLNKIKCNILKENSTLLKNINIEEIQNVANTLFESLLNKKYSNIILVYNKFINSSKYDIVFENITINKTKSNNENTDKEIPNDSLIYESSAEDINVFFKKTIFISKFLTAIYESLTSENASRMITMNKSNDNACNLLKVLKSEYNQTRQASITNEIIEISGGAECLNK